jgi:hypothetical protein
MNYIFVISLRARREISREEEGGKEVVRMTERKEGDK